MSERKLVRCAIYTRKSSDEGLDQAFNSLHAQREACEAYVKSQASEGWKALPKLYDDGGFSGGNMERPALAALLADMDAGKIDTVVVYKVDRLTRSLADFARIVDRLDGAGSSFVSVTQAFNTTTSMGRLTLNVLLSFAQFEREVTGERICDKIAASKAKGMWMGGNLPLGYDLPTDPTTRALVMNPDEAATVQRIFRVYLAVSLALSMRWRPVSVPRVSVRKSGGRKSAASEEELGFIAERYSICCATAPTSAKSLTATHPTPALICQSSSRRCSTPPRSCWTRIGASTKKGRSGRRRCRCEHFCSTPTGTR